MTSPDSITQIAALGVEPTYSAREAAAMLGRSYSWLDQRLRAGQFTNPAGSVLHPLRTPGGYRRFRQSTLRDIALCCYRHWRLAASAQAIRISLRAPPAPTTTRKRRWESFCSEASASTGEDSRGQAPRRSG